MFIKLHEYSTGKPVIIMVDRISIIRIKAIWNFCNAFKSDDTVCKPDYVTNIILNDCYYPDKGNKRKIEIDVQESVDEIYKVLEYSGIMKI